MSGFGVDQGAGGPSAAVLRLTGELGRGNSICRGGRIAKRIRRREPGKIVAVWSRITQSAWAACVRCGELSGAKVILSSLSDTRMSPAVANSSCRGFGPLDRHARSETAVVQADGSRPDYDGTRWHGGLAL
jgi:hypothetical protein